MKVLRKGIPIEEEFLSVMAKGDRGWVMTAGLLARSRHALDPPDLDKQRAEIQDTVALILGRYGISWPDVRSVKVFAPDDVDLQDTISAAASMFPSDTVRPVLSGAGVVALNRPEYMMEMTVHAVTGGPDAEAAGADEGGPAFPPARRCGSQLLLGAHGDGLSSGDLGERYRAALTKLLATMQEFGLGPGDLVATNTFMTATPTAEDLAAIGRVRKELLDADSPPAGVMVRVVELLDGRSAVQLDGVAQFPDRAGGQRD